MPRPTTDVNGEEYRELLKQRELRRLHGADYPDVKWAHDAMDRLEKKQPYGDYTDKDYADFLKAQEIHARVFAQNGTEETAENHTTTHYIWRTRQDGKVRPEHAVNNGKIFAWDNPPPTGHPGEDFGCRCRAEPYKAEGEDAGELQERISQTVSDMAEDNFPAWTKRDFIKHYFLENGRPVTLHEIGHLQNIIAASETTVFKNVAEQICEKARQTGAGTFPYSTINSYEFQLAVYSIGGATVRSNAQVKVEEDGGTLTVTAEIAYNFRDVFTDVFSINELIRRLGKHEAILLTGLIMGINVLGVNTALQLFERIKKEMRLPPETSPDSIGEWDLPGSTAFEITDGWNTKLEAVIKK